jgi:hypothetical protein
MMRVLPLAFLCASIAGAQVMRKEPAIYQAPPAAVSAAVRPPGLRLGLSHASEFAFPALSREETARLTEPSAAMKVGIHRALPPSTMSAGAWESTPQGGRLWRMALRSPGAEGIRIEFDNFSVGNGKLWVHDGQQIAGPYTGRGLYDDGHFWSGTLFSESVTVEYEPENGSAGDALPFEMRAISHRAPRRSSSRIKMDDPQATTADPADYCHLDPNCYHEWQPAMSMVGQLIFEDTGVEYLCSGAAVSTRDNSFKPYLLTAGHCIHSEQSARTIETFWTYQTSSCGATPPASRDSSLKSSVGGHLVGSGALQDGDYSLVLLNDIPSGVTFSGWDITVPDMGAPLVGLHHPKGSWKRISFGNRTADETVNVEGDLAPGDLYLELELQQGRIEPGSSGSPLFSSPGVIVGTLTYGPYSPDLSACEISPFVAGYGRFSNAYAHLRDYFENLPAAEISPATNNLSFLVNGRKSPDPQTVSLTTQSPGQVPFKLRSDAPWIQISTVNGSATQKTPASVQISIDPSQFDQPGHYTGTVSILAGSAAPRFINVRADVADAHSNVQVSAGPNPVVQSGGQWHFTLRLTETGGADTRLTGLSVNNMDYSSHIADWFGTDRLSANGAIEAPLTATGPYLRGTEYIEFWGVDDDGRTWYRTVTLQFQ